MSERKNTRRRVLQAIISRLETIDSGRGSETDAGYRIFLGQQMTLGESDPDVALLIVPGDAEPKVQLRKTLFDWPIEIQILAKTADRDSWYGITEAALADVQAAMESEDMRLEGFPLALATIRQLEGVGQGGLGITYVVQCQQTWGNP